MNLTFRENAKDTAASADESLAPGLVEQTHDGTMSVDATEHSRAAAALEALAVMDVPDSPFVRGIRGLQSQITLRHDTPGCLSLAVVSSERCVGKSLIAANLAGIYALAGFKTLLVDADLRNSSQARFFPSTNNSGLVGILEGIAGPEQIETYSNAPKLFVLHSGATSFQNSNSLGGPAVQSVLSLLKSLYDVVICDTTAVMDSSDALAIASSVWGTLLVTRFGQTDLKDVARLQTNLDSVSATVVGSVINRFGENRKRPLQAGR